MEKEQVENKKKSVNFLKNKYLKVFCSIFITGIFSYIVYILKIPNPNAVLFIVVGFFAFSGGFCCGIPSAIVAILYSFFYFSSRENHVITFTYINAEKLIISSISTIIIVIMVGILVQRLNKKNAELLRVIEKLESISRVDSLTGLSNRRAFDEVYKHKYANARRRKESLVLLMLDIDFFKQYNDTYGHMEGDICLQKIASAFQNTVNRSSDFVARFGGEEFVVLLPDTDKKGAMKVALDIQQNIQEQRIPHKNSSVSEYVTVSIGIEEAHPDETSNPNDFIKNADQALYRAKNSGRNCIVAS